MLYDIVLRLDMTGALDYRIVIRRCMSLACITAVLEPEHMTNNVHHLWWQLVFCSVILFFILKIYYIFVVLGFFQLTAYTQNTGDHQGDPQPVFPRTSLRPHGLCVHLLEKNVNNLFHNLVTISMLLRL